MNDKTTNMRVKTEKRSKIQTMDFTLEMRCRYPSGPFFFFLFCISLLFFFFGALHCRDMALQSTSAKTASIVIHPLTGFSRTNEFTVNSNSFI